MCDGAVLVSYVYNNIRCVYIHTPLEIEVSGGEHVWVLVVEGPVQKVGRLPVGIEVVDVAVDDLLKPARGRYMRAGTISNRDRRDPCAF